MGYCTWAGMNEANRIYHDTECKSEENHYLFIAETKGTMETLNLKPIEQAKIKYTKKLFTDLSTEDVVYHDVDSYQRLLNIMESL